MGLYLYGPEAAFASATSQLCKALESMVAASSIHAEKLLFISSQSRKFLCKHRAAGTSSSATLPVCEFKLAPSLSGFSIMTCRCTSQMHACCVVLPVPVLPVPVLPVLPVPVLPVPVLPAHHKCMPVQHEGCSLLDNRHKTSCPIA